VTSSPDAAGTPAATRLPTSAYDYELPAALIAHHPAAARDASRLLVIDRSSGSLSHAVFRDVTTILQPGDVLVLNETRVIPARLLGTRPGGGEAEFVLLHPAAGTGASALQPAAAAWPADWFALVRPGSKLKPGKTVPIAHDLVVEILDTAPDGTRRVRLHAHNVRDAVERHGHMPLPPYIERPDEACDRERYQTVFARTEGSVAAPTAGLHFTPALLDTLRASGVNIATVLLHVGVGTFRPIEVEDPDEHRMHAEWYQVTEDAAALMNAARAAGGKLWAVGTTVTRTLETLVSRGGTSHATSPDTPPLIHAGAGWTSLFIRPGFEFRAVDRLITNFHLPRSTLLMLVSAFAGHDLTMRAYREAVAEGYRFYSYGDAMAIL
jgi:S-adenosylmethionine:tRNA ribosyltransferase-isomerase